ncbi:hypothetical protein [Kribbella lupini]|uniref:Uncharacterized protein n=1 Tax=Kribbella lupini TaxID=291602 RepID=A0ABN2C2A9_9ACTN
MAELAAAEGDRAGLEVHQEQGADRLADLITKDPMVEACFSNPRVLTAIRHVLGTETYARLSSDQRSLLDVTDPGENGSTGWWGPATVRL